MSRKKKTTMKIKEEIPIIKTEIIENSNIVEGINDLMNLDVEVIRKELKKRGYHPEIIDKMPHWYLVSTLREETNPSTRSYSKYNRVHSTSSNPIFNIEKSEDNKLNSKSNEEEDEEDNFDPNDFNNHKIENDEPKIRPTFGLRQLRNHGILRSHHNKDFSDSVPDEVISSLPNNIQQTIFQNLSQYRANFNLNNNLNTPLSISEIIKDYILPNLIDPIKDPLSEPQITQEETNSTEILSQENYKEDDF